MKTFIASALMLLAPAFVLAQTPAPSAAKPATKATAKAPAKAAAAKTAKAKPTSSRVQLKSATGQVAAGIMAAEAALSPDELAIAERVHVGHIACELGAHVTLKADPASEISVPLLHDLYASEGDELPVQAHEPHFLSQAAANEAATRAACC